MRLIVISSPGSLENEARWVNQLFEAGMRCFHLRKPAANRAELHTFLNKLDPAYLKDVVLHQHHGLASDFNLNRLHYTESARLTINPDLLANQLDCGFNLSSSVHDFAVIPGLKAFEYVFYGPVFNSISKPGYHGNLPPDFRLPKINAAPAVIALGGIDASNIGTVHQMNFDGAAVLGAIWNGQDTPLKNFLHLHNSLNQIT